MNVRPGSGYRRLAVATAVLVYLLIVMGGIVRVTGSGLGCADQWPSCNGALLPAWNEHSIIEFLHRIISVLAGVAVVAMVLSTWFWQRRFRRLVVASTLAAFLYVLQAALGAIVVKYSLPGGVVMIHLANALLLLGVLTYLAVQSITLGTARTQLARHAAQPAAVAAAATYVLALSGAFVVENGAGGACTAWPLCGGGFTLPAGEFAVINVAHRIVAAVVVIGVGAVMGIVLRRHRGDRALRRAVMVVNALLVLQIAAGALVVIFSLPAAVRGLHLALASALWAAVVAVAVFTRARAEVPAREGDAAGIARLNARTGVATS